MPPSADIDTAGRNCLVTGASSGIGRAVAARMVADGWTVTVLVRRDDAPTGTQVVIGDASATTDLQRAIEIATGPDGRLQGLVCAAGLPPSGPWDDVDHWADVLRVDLTAPYDAKVPGGLLPAGAAGTSADRFVGMVYSQLKGRQ